MPRSYTGVAPRASCDSTSPGSARPLAPPPWEASASCVGQTALMYDHAQRAQAQALCASCPVLAICLWATMAAEGNEPHPYRYGTAGGLGPLQRRRLAARLSPVDIDAHRVAAMAAWRAEPRRAASFSSWRPPAPRYRSRRKCRGCDAVIRQPRAGRPQLWCSSACQWRTTRDRVADATRSRQRWAQLPATAKDRRRAAMRARWAALSARDRAEVAAQRRHRRLAARVAS